MIFNSLLWCLLIVTLYILDILLYLSTYSLYSLLFIPLWALVLLSGFNLFLCKIILQWICWWQMFPVLVCVKLMLLSSPYIRYVWLGIHFQVNTSLFSTLKASLHCCWLSLLWGSQLKVFSWKVISFFIVCFQDFFLFETEISLWHD